MTATSPEAPATAPPRHDGWWATADHKRLGLLFLAFSAAFLLVGVATGTVLRAELLDEGVQVAGNEYRRLFSLHATVSTMLFLPAAWIGLATYLVPLQIGAGRLAFPRLQAMALWLFAMGGIVVLVGYIVGPTNGLGIVSSTPVLPPGAGSGAEATTLVIAGLALVAASTILAAAVLAVTVLKLRTPGLTLLRTPLFTWATLLSSLVVVLATPVFLAGLVLFYLDQRFGGGMFATANAGAASIWRHTVWIYGRPEIYLVLLPGLGAAGDIVATHARRPLLSLDAARGALTLFAVSSFGAWAAASSTGDAIVVPTYSPLTALVVVPLGLLVLVWLATLATGHLRRHVSLLFVAGFVLLCAFAAANAVIAAATGVTGRAWTTGHVHAVVFAAPTLLLLGAISHWAPKMFGRELSPFVSRAAFLGVFGGAGLMALGSYLLGYDGAPARVRDFPMGGNGSTFSLLSMVGACVLLAGLLAFLLDVIRAAAGRQRAPDDPYESFTLEWATSSPPPPHSFDSVPEVRSAHPLLDLREAERRGSSPAMRDEREEVGVGG